MNARMIVLLVVLFAVPLRAADVTTCGEIHGGSVNVVADLTCGAQTAIRLSNRAVLHVNGHTVQGDLAVECLGKCTIQGPGILAGKVLVARRAQILDVVVDGGGIAGVESNVTLTNVTVRNFGGFDFPFSNGIWVRKLKVQNVTVEDGTNFGISAKTLRGENLTVRNASDHGVLVTRRIRLSGFVATGNGGAGAIVNAGSMRIEGGEVSGNGAEGLRADRSVRVQGMTVTGNPGHGVAASRSLRLEDSSVTGNGSAAPSGLFGDIFAGTKVRLENTTCGTSRRPGAIGATWGVCDND